MNPSSRKELDALIAQYHERFCFPAGGDMLPLVRTSLRTNSPIAVEVGFSTIWVEENISELIDFAQTVYSHHIHPDFTFKLTKVRVQEPVRFYESFNWLSSQPASKVQIYVDEEFNANTFSSGFSHAKYLGSGHIALQANSPLSLTVLSHELTHGILGAGHCNSIPTNQVNKDNFCMADWCNMDDYCVNKSPDSYFCPDHAQVLRKLGNR